MGDLRELSMRSDWIAFRCRLFIPNTPDSGRPLQVSELRTWSIVVHAWALVCVVGLFAGALSALTRISAPFTVIPILVIALGVNIRSAVAASLVTVVATASNSAVMYFAVRLFEHEDGDICYRRCWARCPGGGGGRCSAADLGWLSPSD